MTNFFTSISTISSEVLRSLADASEWFFTYSLTIGEFTTTPLQFMLGAGLVTYMVYVIAIFIGNIIT